MTMLQASKRSRAGRWAAIWVVTMTICSCVAAGDGAPPGNASDRASLTERNRAVVEKFVDVFYRQRDVRKAFETYVAADYLQHNPNIADGREAAIAALEPMFSKPDAQFDVKRVIVDGDLAAVHLFGRGDPKTAGAAVVDLFRLEKGLIVEHWDVLQPMPAKSANSHPMF